MKSAEVIAFFEESSLEIATTFLGLIRARVKARVAAEQEPAEAPRRKRKAKAAAAAGRRKKGHVNGVLEGQEDLFPLTAAADSAGDSPVAGVE